MLTTLAFRHFKVRKVRSAFLLLGFVFGVAAMIVLLSVGQAMLDQSRDVSLVGGGEVTILPQGIDVEALRTGAAGAQFFGIDRAKFMTRQILGGERQRHIVTAVAPVIERKLIYLKHGDRTITVRAGAEIPSRSRALGAGLRVLQGRWDDAPADSAYVAPTLQQLYDDLDHFHPPHRTDSTWAEWHYFNIVTGPGEWIYLTYLIHGNVSAGRGGGVLLLNRHRADGRYERYTAEIPAERVAFSTKVADLTLGENTVRQRNGDYHLKARAKGSAGVLDLDVVVRPARNRYLPPLEISEAPFLSGYVVPAVAAEASGRICVASRCQSLTSAPAYHDHNWGIWRDATWEWGVARGARLNVVYGGVYNADQAASPFFLMLVDSAGVEQVLRFRDVDYRDFRPARNAPAQVPGRFTLVAHRDADTVKLDVNVRYTLATLGGPSAGQRYFVQMQGDFTLTGRIAGRPVADSGSGFFETYVPGITSGPWTTNSPTPAP